MDLKITLFDQGNMATYSVEQLDVNTFAIRLKTFQGENKPPLYIKLQKTGAGWESAFHNKSLISDVGFAIDSNMVLH
ncbi:MAG: hypothetical protein ACXWV0_05690 [Flavisolibacter sp.]